MFSQSKRHSLLYFVTALLLLMQSLALWHDAEHVFHAENEHCERFEGFSNSPVLDQVPLLAIITPIQTRLVDNVSTFTFLQTNQREAYAIRAPPTTFS